MFYNQLIYKITNNLESFSYNVIIANMYETYNFLINHIKNNKNINNLTENYKKLLICFLPIIPHFVNECLTDLNLNKNIEWPEFDKSTLLKEKVNIVIQVDGKKRAIFCLVIWIIFG